MFVVLALLLLAIRQATPRPAFYLGMLQGMTGMSLTLAWLFHLFGPSAIPLHAILAAFTALTCALISLVVRRTGSDLAKVFAVAVLWTAVEYYRCEWFVLRFPWATPGTALGPTWLSPVLGVYGATFAMVAACAAVIHRRTRLGGLIGIAALAGLALFRPPPVELPGAAAVGVALVQSEECTSQPYLKLTEQALAKSPSLIVWPEYSLAYDVRKRSGIWQSLREMSVKSRAVMVVGTQTEVGPGARDWHNTALVLDRGQIVGEYHKARPVHFFDDGIAGNCFEPIHTRVGALGVLVCFDADYVELARRTVAAGAEFLIVPSFDAAPWSATQHLQHGALFRLRAAENGRWLACAASSGASQIIDPHGNVRAKLPVMEDGLLPGAIAPATGRTFFNRVGWLFPWLATAAAAALLASTFLRRWHLPKTTPNAF